MKSIRILLVCTLLMALSCTTTESNGSATITIEASGLSDGKLALNASANFTASVTEYEGDTAALSYRWSLSTGRGKLSDGTSTSANTAEGGNTMSCIGKDEGGESITVEALDASNSVIGSNSYAFEIVGPTDIVVDRGCFDQPKIIYQRGSGYYLINEDGSNGGSVGASGGTSVAISPNGQWIATNPYDNDNPPIGYNMHVQRCGTRDKIRVPSDNSGYEYYAYDAICHFSLDSKTLYFMRPHLASKPDINRAVYSDIAAYDVETGEKRFLTSLYVNEESVGNFTVSPITGEIAFFRHSYQDIPGGGYSVTHTLSFLQPESGLIRDFATLPPGRYDYGLDWSPDGKDIIYSATTADAGRGIFRINLTDGSQPLLVFEDPSPNSLPPGQPHYYANGTRIVWSGQENGQNNINFWSIDANGNDMQLFFEATGVKYLQGVLY